MFSRSLFSILAMFVVSDRSVRLEMHPEAACPPTPTFWCWYTTFSSVNHRCYQYFRRWGMSFNETVPPLHKQSNNVMLRVSQHDHFKVGVWLHHLTNQKGWFIKLLVYTVVPIRPQLVQKFIVLWEAVIGQQLYWHSLNAKI